jgi:hypothetical protein
MAQAEVDRIVARFSHDPHAWPDDREIKVLFHWVWSLAVGVDGYEKQTWLTLGKMLVSRGIHVW